MLADFDSDIERFIGDRFQKMRVVRVFLEVVDLLRSGEQHSIIGTILDLALSYPHLVSCVRTPSDYSGSDGHVGGKAAKAYTDGVQLAEGPDTSQEGAVLYLTNKPCRIVRPIFICYGVE